VSGVATGLAWTPAGGDILFVEATSIPARQADPHGPVGDVMKKARKPR